MARVRAARKVQIYMRGALDALKMKSFSFSANVQYNEKSTVTPIVFASKSAAILAVRSDDVD